ncbi:MAG: 16S rRNA (guanine(966)-N(2))-methyltransferase RsmD [Chloroflexi bacterium]|nr:16S rRNA (guanine(966)-N(2))-methyltransferase RsmD [Chloroflexota bacterium]
MSVRITGGEHRGRRLRSYRGGDLRPTSDRVRGAIFSILGLDAVEGARVLDLYSGTGALGIEALSRGAAWVDFVEANARRCQQIGESLRELSLEGRGKVYKSRVESILDSLPGAYELIFADPPYDTAPWETLMDDLSRHGLIKQNGVVVVEHRYGTALAERYDGLAQVSSRRYGDTSVSFYKVGVTNG